MSTNIGSKSHVLRDTVHFGKEGDSGRGVVGVLASSVETPSGRKRRKASREEVEAGEIKRGEGGTREGRKKLGVCR